jgi:hypothetical protein
VDSMVSGLRLIYSPNITSAFWVQTTGGFLAHTIHRFYALLAPEIVKHTKTINIIMYK